MAPFTPPTIEPGTGILHGVCVSATGTYEARVVLQTYAQPVVFPISEAKARELGPHVGRLLDVSLTCYLVEAGRLAQRLPETLPGLVPSGSGGEGG